MKRLEIRTMSREQVDMAVDWAAAEGWNPGLHDAETFFGADPNGFFTGLVDGEPVSVISGVRYGESFGFIGLYIVKPKFRGQGHGIRVWNAALDYLRGRNIGLDGVPEQQSNYRKSGFRYAYRNIRFEGRGTGDYQTSVEIRELSTLPFDQINGYDRRFFPDDRSSFLRGWVAQPGSSGLGVVTNSTLMGYGVLRPCRLGYKIGPLFGDGPEVAEALLSALLASAERGAPVYFDVPEVNAMSVELAERHEMRVVFETARMYTKDAPALPMKDLYGVTTFELG